MGLERFSKVQPKGTAPDAREFVEMQLRLERVLQRLTDCPIIDGILIEGMALTAATNKIIEHKLGRAYRGYVITKSSGPAVIDEQGSANPDRTKFLALRADVNTTINVWVF